MMNDIAQQTGAAPNEDTTVPPVPVRTEPASLQTLQQSLDRMNTRIDRIAKVTHADAPQEKPGKLLMAGIFAFIGLKFCALAFGKVGYVIDMSRAVRDHGLEGVKLMFTSIFSAIRGKGKGAKEWSDMHHYTLIGGGIATVVGPIAGAALGFARGDRLDSPGDLITHPVESFHKIFADHPPKKDAAPTITVTAERQMQGLLSGAATVKAV